MSKFILSGFGDEIADSLGEQLRVMADEGFFAIELRGVNGRSIATYSPDEARGIKRALDEAGFVVSAIGSPIGKYDITEPLEPQLELMERMVGVARVLEARYIRLFSFFLPEGSASLYRGEVLRRMRALKAVARGSGVMLLHENEADIYGDTAARCADLMRELCDADFQLIFDASNFVQVGEADVWAAWELLREHVVYLHIKDSVRPGGKREGRDMGFQGVSDSHRLVGDGEGRVRDILADLRARGFEGYLSLEPHLTNCELVPGSAEDKWRAAAGALKTMIAGLG